MTRTTSAWPVRPVQTSSYVGLGVEPPAYPTEVDQTPGTSQNVFSSPQKQPSPNTATPKPSGAWVSTGLPSVRWVPPTW